MANLDGMLLAYVLSSSMQEAYYILLTNQRHLLTDKAERFLEQKITEYRAKPTELDHNFGDRIGTLLLFLRHARQRGLETGWAQYNERVGSM